MTNGPADVQRAKIGLLGLDRLVDFVVISGELGVSKPDPVIFAEALRVGNASAAATVFVGDSPEFDVAGAAAAGIASIWINRGGGPWRTGRKPGFEVARLANLVALFETGRSIALADGSG